MREKWFKAMSKLGSWDRTPASVPKWSASWYTCAADPTSGTGRRSIVTDWICGSARVWCLKPQIGRACHRITSTSQLPISIAPR